MFEYTGERWVRALCMGYGICLPVSETGCGEHRLRAGGGRRRAAVRVWPRLPIDCNCRCRRRRRALRLSAAPQLCTTAIMI
ncbi:unnamed protein product [Danaus chrysippus]|uniref:(African queen) hypothetical protein n=1 Tax=Danaus chrysippus TaxID=151541 RepID=A0A8J2VYY3_9NEOP|nr:unnamed protein product [Danaus chrysippus]